MTLQDTLHLCKILHICGTKFCCLLVHNMTLPPLFLQQWPRTVQKVVQPLISQVHSWSILGTFPEKSQISEISNLGKFNLQFSFLKAVDFVVSGLRVFGQCVDSWRVSARFRLVSFAARRSWTGLLMQHPGFSVYGQSMSRNLIPSIPVLEFIRPLWELSDHIHPLLHDLALSITKGWLWLAGFRACGGEAHRAEAAARHHGNEGEGRGERKEESFNSWNLKSSN